MGLLIDTSVLVAEERGEPLMADLEAQNPEATPVIAAITAAELLLGAHRADARHRARREAFVEKVLEQFPILPFDLPAAREHARVSAQLAALGTPLSPVDLIIAATALASGHTVATRDKKSFPRVPGLKTIVI